MPVLYALVAKDTTVLCEHTTCAGNFTAIARKLLNKASKNNNEKRTYICDAYAFHYSVRNELVFLCMSDQKSGRAVPFKFLEEMQEEFFNQFGDVSESTGGTSSFGKVLKTLMEKYSKVTEVDKIMKLQKELDEVTDIVRTNIEKTVTRGEQISSLVDKTQKLKDSTHTFRVKSRALRQSLWRQNAKLICTLTILILLGVYFFLVSFCGGFTLSGCTS
eukprot:GILK01009327.1.p1 GENE.GILK01009327.1~~GILK01009327.1.p1  ORF type:complete len:218 (-),score=9.80 GILK01009327.1:111-764(-)